MEINMGQTNFPEILLNYGIDPDACNISEYTRGHINDSYIVDVRQSYRFFLQRINHHVFKDPGGLIENHVKVNAAMAAHYGGEKKSPYPRIIKNKDQKYFCNDREGNFWRLLEFVPGSRSFNIASTTGIAFEGAAAFGAFQMVMNKERPSAYTPTIPGFHHLGNRLRQLQTAVDTDPKERVKYARPEITFVLDRMEYAAKLEELLLNKIIPVRVTHNDTKLNNVLFKEKEIKYICVVDLDTVMPGTVLYDYGDMVRTFTSPVEEDEPDPEKVLLRTDIFEALTNGYLGALKDSLSTGEKEYLLFGAKVMLLMIGTRFLTDFLEGDHYFKIARKEHNLIRSRNQFALLKQLEDKENSLQAIIRSCL